MCTTTVELTGEERREGHDRSPPALRDSKDPSHASMPCTEQTATSPLSASETTQSRRQSAMFVLVKGISSCIAKRLNTSTRSAYTELDS